MTKGHLGLKTTSKELSTKEDEVEAAIVKKPRGWSSWASTIKMDVHLELFLKSSLSLSERILVMVSTMIPNVQPVVALLETTRSTSASVQEGNAGQCSLMRKMMMRVLI